jgi:hypothetical protein
MNTELNSTFFVYENIIRLDVSVHDHLAMHDADAF